MHLRGTTQVREDVLTALAMPGAKVLLASFDRQRIATDRRLSNRTKVCVHCTLAPQPVYTLLTHTRSVRSTLRCTLESCWRASLHAPL
jgi:hypothetical protein